MSRPLIRSLLLASALLACTSDKDGGADTGGPDGGTSDGGVTDGGVSDGGTGDGGVGDGGTSDGGTSDGGTSDGGTSDGGTGDGGTELGVGARCELPDAAPVPAGDIVLERAFAPLSFSYPIFMTQAPGDDSRWWVIEQYGQIVTFENGSPTEHTDALDLSDDIYTAYECGVLGLAFDPDFATNGYAYVVYTVYEGRDLMWHLSRFETDDGGLTFDRASELQILSVEQPYENHNGGAIHFGPDGYLYISLGDGGSGGDPLGHGQNTNTLFGSILRIDVSGSSESEPYTVPADNPFGDDGALAGEGREEIYAWGIRNAWGMSFDTATGELWAGDVGQYLWEEVDRVELGGNYGWAEVEGEHCYASGCDIDAYIGPETEYPHSLGESITGGVVYRGDEVDLYGAYLYADFVSGRIWALEEDPGTGEREDRILLEPSAYWSGFAQDQDGEVYMLSMYEGRIYKITAADDTADDAFPAQLSLTGCVDDSAPDTVSPGLLPYEVVHGFWSDGADKARWLSLPEGSVMTVNDDGDIDLPAGSVVVKDFLLDGERFETRLLAHHEDGTWAGYSYQWREDGSDADLLDGSLRADVGDQTWHFPSRAECRSCHTDAAGVSLGLEVAQLGDTLEDWRAAGFVEGDADVVALVDRDDADVDAAARAWLHTNCAMCHQPDAPGAGGMDLRWGTSVADMGICEAPERGDLGLSGARIVMPGDPTTSVLHARILDEGAWRMPPLGSLVVDEEGAALIGAWIETEISCD